MSLDIMDATDQEEQPRRGNRVRKSVDKFQPTQGKKRRLDQSDEDTSSEESEEEETRPRRKKSGDQPAKAKVTKTKTKRVKAATLTTRVVEAPQGEVGIKDDCALFNALLNPDIVLKSTVEDWVESYQGAAGDEALERDAVHQMVLFFVRCCGLSEDIDEDEAMDIDGIADVVERIEEESAKTVAAVYPLVSKAKPFRAFRKNLNLFLPHLIETLSLTPILYHTSKTTTHTTPLLPLLTNWLYAMSSSALRPLRHTSTYMSLRINSALCDVAESVNKDFTLKQRQREAEAKKTTGTAAQKKERTREADKKVREAHEQKTLLEEMMQETMDTVCVHRLRDSDAAIRTDCFRELGVWIRAYPPLFGDDQYLGYLSWGCNDGESHARVQTVKALYTLYENDAFANSHRNTTHRLASRLINMAIRDVDISVRVKALQTVTEIDKTGFLEDEGIAERSKVPKLLFDSDIRVRKAVGPFIEGMWSERVETLKTEWQGAVGNKKKRSKGIDEETMEGYLGRKALAEILLETSQSLGDETGEDGQKGLTTLSRALALVEALQPHINVFEDWEALGEYLLMDHSGGSDDAWLLGEEEESVMLQVFIACVKLEEENEDERTTTLMTMLPRLIAKNQSDPARVAAVLALVQSMKLDLYLDMRKVAAYESLWDDITKHFLTQTSPDLLSAAISAINTLSLNAALSTQNVKKLSELSDALFTSLRTALEDEDVAVLAMSADQLEAVQAILLRLVQLARSRDVVEMMEDEEGGQTSAWDICRAFVERGELGYGEEAKIVEYAIQIVFLHVTWRFKRFTPEDGQDEEKVKALEQIRDGAVQVFQRLALNDRSNAAESVRRHAFIAFLNTHVLFSANSAAPAAKAASIFIADDVQHRLGGAFQATIERFASDLEESDDKRDKLEFYGQVAALVGAIRRGVLEVDHAKEILAHVGRLEPTYDAIARKLVDVLRDEGIYNRHSDTIQHVAFSALESSFNAFLETDSPEPVAPLALTKMLAQAFTIHGTHFSVLKQLHPDDAHDFHTSGVDYVVRKVGLYIKQERANKQKEVKQRIAAKRAQALTFFKCLVPLLGPVNGRDALRVRAHMGEEMDKAGVVVEGKKAWDAYRVYEKRLVLIASRDENVKSASQRVVKGKGKKAGRTRGGEEEEEEEVEEAEMEVEIERTETSLSPAPGGDPEAETERVQSKGREKGGEKGARNGSGSAGGSGAKKNGLGRQASSANLQADEEEDEGDGVEEEEEEEEGDAEEEAEEDDEDAGNDTLLAAPVDFDAAVDLDLDLNMDLDLDMDEDFNNAEFPAASQVLAPRGRSVSVEPGAKRRRVKRDL